MPEFQPEFQRLTERHAELLASSAEARLINFANTDARPPARLALAVAGALDRMAAAIRARYGRDETQSVSFWRLS